MVYLNFLFLISLKAQAAQTSSSSGNDVDAVRKRFVYFYDVMVRLNSLNIIVAQCSKYYCGSAFFWTCAKIQ